MSQQSDIPRSSWSHPINPALAPQLCAALSNGTIGSREDENRPEDLFRLAMLAAVRSRGTDVHIEPSQYVWRVRMRVDGLLHEAAELEPEDGLHVIRYAKTLASLDPRLSHMPQDFRLRYKAADRTLDLRLAFAPCLAGEKLVVRVLSDDRLIKDASELGLDGRDAQLLEESLNGLSGLCLVAGPTGGGKTTTLYALMHNLSRGRCSILTIEDPVEHRIDGISQIEVDEAHGLTFENGLKSMRRLDSDIMVVGEIRDRASARTAVSAAIAGQVVLGTVHSRDAVGAVTTLRNWDVADFETAASLELVIAQRLVRKLCGECRIRRAPGPAEAKWLTGLGLRVPRKIWGAKGCDKCFMEGYSGRTGMFEIWRLSRADLDRILTHQHQSELRKAAQDQGVRSLAEDGLAKAEDGVTSIDEVRRRCDVSGTVASSASNGGGRRKPCRKSASRRRGPGGG